MSSLTAELAAPDEGRSLPQRQKGRLMFLPFDRLCPFRDHPFRLYAGERLEDMVESIRHNGILMPLIVRHIAGGEACDYEVLSGHNRMNAGKLAGLEGAWCLVKEGLSDGEALMYVIETNLLQRSFTDLLPSEKAAVLAMRYSEMFSQGKRNDIIEELRHMESEASGGTTCGTEFHRSRSRDTLGQEYALTGRQIAKYVSLDRLTAALKVKLDSGELTINSGAALSHLDGQAQACVAGALERCGKKLTDAQAARLRALGSSLTLPAVMAVLNGERDRAPASIRIKSAVYAPYFAADTPKKEIERTIREALALYFRQKETSP